MPLNSFLDDFVEKVTKWYDNLVYLGITQLTPCKFSWMSAKNGKVVLLKSC